MLRCLSLLALSSGGSHRRRRRRGRFRRRPRRWCTRQSRCASQCTAMPRQPSARLRTNQMCLQRSSAEKQKNAPENIVQACQEKNFRASTLTRPQLCVPSGGNVRVHGSAQAYTCKHANPAPRRARSRLLHSRNSPRGDRRRAIRSH